jgi:hypothetical protein
MKKNIKLSKARDPVAFRILLYALTTENIIIHICKAINGTNIFLIIYIIFPERKTHTKLLSRL